MSDLQFEQVANIKVFGIGGGGCNAVNRKVSRVWSFMLPTQIFRH